MDFIQIGYMVTVPLLLLWSRWDKGIQSIIGMRLLAVSNLLLISHAVFLFRQITGSMLLAESMAKQMGIDATQTFQQPDGYTIRLISTMCLPLLFLFKKLRYNGWITLVMLVLLYWNYPPVLWNGYDLLWKILTYACLLCSGFAALWLLRQLPAQET